MQKFNGFVDKYSKHSVTVLRIFLGLVFIFFGWTSITAPGSFTSLVPAWTSILGAAETLVRIHGVFEIALGIMLAFGIQARIVAFVLFLDLLHVLTLLKFGPVWIRDFGLAGAMLSAALAKRD
jgi:uncharacterized membrane protein YphA (DoxX/SURF4 family)